MYSCSKFLGLFSSLGSTLTIFCIILKVDFLCSAPSMMSRNQKWIDGNYMSSGGTWRFSNVYVHNRINVYGNLVDASDTSHVSALFERESSQKLFIVNNSTNNSMYLNATLQPGKRHAVKLNTSLKVHGEYVHFATPSRVMLSSASHQGLKLCVTKDCNKHIAVIHVKKPTAGSTHHIDLEASLLIRNGSCIRSQELNMSSSSTLVPPNSLSVYIRKKIGDGNLRLPKPTRIGHRILILRNDTFPFTIAPSSNSTYGINSNVNKSILMERSISKVDCAQSDSLAEYICIKYLFSGGRDIVDYEYSHWQTVEYTARGDGLSTLRLGGQASRKLLSTRLNYLPDYSGTVITTGNLFDIAMNVPSNRIHVVENLEVAGIAVIGSIPSKSSITFKGIISPHVEGNNAIVLQFKGLNQSKGITRIASKRRAALRNNAILVPDVSGKMLTTGNLNDIQFYESVSSAKIEGSLVVGEKVVFGWTKSKFAFSRFSNTKVKASVILGKKRTRHADHVKIKPGLVRFLGQINTFCSGETIRAIVSTKFSAVAARNATHIHAAQMHNWTSGQLVEILEIEGIEATMLNQAYSISRINSFDFFVDTFIYTLDRPSTAVLRCIPSLSFRKSSHFPVYSLLLDDRKGAKATKQQNIQIPKLTRSTTYSRHTMLSSRSNFTSYLNISGQDRFGSLKLKKSAYFGQNNSEGIIMFNGRLRSGSCGMISVSVAAILQVEPLVVKTSSLHTFQKNDNVYLGSRHEIEDKHSTFVVLNVTNQTLTLVNAYGKYNKAAMVQIMEYCAIHLCETIYTVRCRATLIFGGNTTLNVQTPSQDNHIKFKGRSSASTNIQIHRLITSGNSPIIKHVGKLKYLNVHKNLTLNGSAALGTVSEEASTVIRGSLLVSKNKSTTSHSPNFACTARSLRSNDMVTISSNNVSSGTILQLNGRSSAQVGNEHVKVIHLEDNSNFLGKAFRITAHKLHTGEMLRIFDRSEDTLSNSSSTVPVDKSISSNKTMLSIVSNTTGAITNNTYSHGSKLLRIRSLNSAEVVTTIQAKSMRKGVLLNLHSAGRQSMSSGLLDAACDRVVYVDNLNCINVLLMNWKFKVENCPNMFGSGDVVALINKENHEKKAHYVVKSVIKLNDDQNEVTVFQNHEADLICSSIACKMYACKIPGGLLSLEGNAQKGGVIMSIEGEHVSDGTILQIRKKHSSNSLANTEAALLHIKTNSTSFVNATLFSQSTLKEANSTVMLIKSNSNAEGTLLKLTASGKEYSKMLSISAASSHNQGALLDIDSSNFIGSSPIGIRIRSVANGDHTLLRLNSRNLKRSMVLIQGAYVERGTIMSINGSGLAGHTEIFKISSKSLNRSMVPIVKFSLSASTSGTILDVASLGSSEEIILAIIANSMSDGHVVSASAGESHRTVGTLLRIETPALYNYNDKPLVVLTTPQFRRGSIFRISTNNISVPSTSTFMHLVGGNPKIAVSAKECTLLRLGGPQFSGENAVVVNTVENENAKPITIHTSSRILKLVSQKETLDGPKKCLACVVAGDLVQGNAMSIDAPVLESHGNIMTIVSNGHDAYANTASLGEVVKLYSSSQFSTVSLHKAGHSNQPAVVLDWGDGTTKEASYDRASNRHNKRHVTKYTGQLQIHCVGAHNATCSGIFVNHSNHMQVNTGMNGGLVYMKLSDRQRSVGAETDALHSVNISMMKLYGCSDVRDLVSIIQNSTYYETMENMSPPAGISIESSISEMFVLSHMPLLNNRSAFFKRNGSFPKLWFDRPVGILNRTNSTTLGSLSFQSSSTTSRTEFASIKMQSDMKTSSLLLTTRKSIIHDSMLRFSANMFEISHYNRFTITRPEASTGNGKKLVLKAHRVANGTGGKMILSSGSSSSNANGLIKMIQEPSKIVLGATSLRFEKTKMLSKMALLVGLPSAIEDKSMQFFFRGANLALDLVKVVQTNMGRYMSPEAVSNHAEVNGSINVNRSMQAFKNLASNRIDMSQSHSDRNIDLVVSLKNQNKLKFVNENNKTIMSISNSTSSNRRTLPQYHVNGYVISKDINGTLLKSRVPIKYITTERNIELDAVLPRTMIVIDRKANGNNLPIHFNFQDVKYPSASWTISIGKTQYATGTNEEIFLTFAKNTKLVFNLKLYTRHPSANKLAVYFEHEITNVPASDRPWEGDVVVMLCQGIPLLPGSYLKVLKVAATNMFFISGSLFHNSFNDAEKLFAGESKFYGLPKYYMASGENRCVFRKH